MKYEICIALLAFIVFCVLCQALLPIQEGMQRGPVGPFTVSKDTMAAIIAIVNTPSSTMTSHDRMAILSQLSIIDPNISPIVKNTPNTAPGVPGTPKSSDEQIQQLKTVIDAYNG